MNLLYLILSESQILFFQNLGWGGGGQGRRNVINRLPPDKASVARKQTSCI